MASFLAFLNSPVGPKTTHFWGPVANCGFVVAGLVDMQNPPEMISGNMSAGNTQHKGGQTLLIPKQQAPSSLVTCKACSKGSTIMLSEFTSCPPRNYLLLACHASNETVQMYQFSRWLKHQGFRRRGCSSTVPKSAKSWYVKNQKQESMVVDDAFSSKWRCSAKHKTFP
ncbi:putative mitochondrial pyruvate carrier [Helianthus annuus]|nr:putative mitochondrial pyruvate carrier [Helianthus annuus]KAJ0597163.1 putative mitochondrial pyruvate carrier [Helianthus annuus]KAJ0757844.1 putative mitochondrial pyruvate carrier [Helianthus annuus]KAJ0761513.1 putative mitochondrial pyruvate carrier [Helianthus annuus]